MTGARARRGAQAGFSLLEVLIAGALLSGIAIGISEMFLNQAKAQRQAKQKADLLQLQQQLQTAAISPAAVVSSAEVVHSIRISAPRVQGGPQLNRLGSGVR